MPTGVVAAPAAVLRAYRTNLARAAILAATILVFSHVAGCTKLIPPRLTVTQIGTRPPTPAARAIEITVRAENMNARPIPLTLATYSVRTGGVRSRPAVRSPQLTIPPFGTVELVLPAVVPASIPIEAPVGVTGEIAFDRPGFITERLLNLGTRSVVPLNAEPTTAELLAPIVRGPNAAIPPGQETASRYSTGPTGRTVRPARRSPGVGGRP